MWQERAQTRATQMTHMPSLKPLCLLCKNQDSLRHRRVICWSERKRTPHLGPPILKVPDPENPRESLISPKVNVISPKINAISSKVNVEYFKGICENLKFLQCSVGGSRSQGFQKYRTQIANRNRSDFKSQQSEITARQRNRNQNRL